MSFKAWPFLVSRNRYIDYRTIVAPDFICDANISNLLARVAEGDLTESNQAIIRQVVNSKVDDFTIVFQVVMAKEKDIDTKGNDRVIIDQFGREIYLFEGVVIKGIGDVYLIDKDLEKAHKQSIESYRKFWKLIEPPPVTPSQYFSTGTIDSGKLLKLEKIRRFDAKYQQKYSNKKFLNLRLYSSKYFEKEITSVAFISDGKSIVVKDRDLRIFIWEFPFNESICYKVEQDPFSRFDSKILNDLNGHRVTFDYNHGNIKIWNSKTNKEEFSIKTKISSVKTIAFSPENKTLAAGGDASDNYVDAFYLQVWDLSNSTINEIPISDEYSHGDVVNSVTFSPDGQILVSAGEDKVVKIWNFE